jgi:hypothetical protein
MSTAKFSKRPNKTTPSPREKAKPSPIAISLGVGGPRKPRKIPDAVVQRKG